jgi:GTP-binding protein
MGHQFQKGNIEFIAGFSNPGQLKHWLSQNPKIAGLAFVGRSNAGKSTLINSLFGKNTARTSNTPGRTQQINVFKFHLLHDGKQDLALPDYYFFDLPGYGFSKVSKATKKNWDLLMTNFFIHLPKGISLITLQDARHPNQKVDQDFLSFLEAYSLKSIVCFNKTDKLKTQSEKRNLKEASLLVKKALQIYLISAEKKSGLEVLEQALIGALLNDS